MIKAADFIITMLLVLAILAGLSTLFQDNSNVCYTNLPTVPNEVTTTEDIIINIEPSTESELDYYPQVPLSAALKKHIVLECDKYQIPPIIIFAMIWRETDYGRYRATYDSTVDRYEHLGDNGKSYGIMQIQQHYYQDEMVQLGLTDLKDNFQNVTLGIFLMNRLIKQYEVQYPNHFVACALLAYNRGTGGANSYIKKHGLASVKENEYVKTIFQEMSRIIDFS